MKNAVKLPLKLDLSFFKEDLLRPHHKYTKLQKRFSKSALDNFVPYTRTMHLSNADELLRALPKSVLELETPQVFLLEIPATKVSDPFLPIHIDINRMCGINIYLEANGETTVFYKWDKTTRVAEPEEEFCAGVGECWLMNTRVPHAVRMVSNTRRRLITYSFVHTKYDEVLRKL